MPYKTDKPTTKDSSKNYYLATLVKGLNSFYQRLSILVLFLFISTTFSLGLSLNTQAETLITNTATASFSINGIAQNLSDSAQFTKDAIIPDPMTLQKQANKTTATNGDLITYTLTINNPNNEPLNNITIQDTLPSGLLYEADTTLLNGSKVNNNQISNTGNQLVFTLGNIPANSTWLVSYQLKVTASAIAVDAINQAVVHSDNVNSNTSQATVTIIPKVIIEPLTPLLLNKQSDKSSAQVDETIHYTLTINNNNAVEVKDIRVKDTLPTGVEYKPDSAVLTTNTGNNVTVITSNGLVFELGNIPANSQWTLAYDAVITNAVDTFPLVNSAQIITENSDTDSAISQVSVDFISGQPADGAIIIDKLANKQRASINDEVTYTVTIQNPEQRELTHLIIHDELPIGFIYQSGSAKADGQNLSANQVLVNGRSLQVSLGSLASKQSLSLSYQVTVTENAVAGSAINTVQASSDHAISNTATASVKVRTPSIIEFLKVDNDGTEALIPLTFFNDNKSAGKHRQNKNSNTQWKEISSIVLANGSTVSLPTSQPLIKALEYTSSDPIIIQATDLDQNTNSNSLETIFVTINIPKTNDKEVLRLTEIAPNAGIFRGAIQATINTTQLLNGRLSLVDGAKITVNYRDEEDSTDISATAALVVPETKLILSKTVDKHDATIGELVRYTLTFDNTTRFTLPTVKVNDTLPVGFRYLAGSATFNGTKIQNEVSANDRSLVFNLKDMPRGSHWTLEYVIKVTAGVQVGKAINLAQIISGQSQSNIARATVNIKDDLMRSRNILTGRVYIGCATDESNTNSGSPDNKYNPEVLKNARIYLETGRSVISDEEGFWHMEGIQAGSHVLQLDADSLPDGYEPLLCRDNTRHSGDAKSKFVDLQAGSLWQVDFHVKATSQHQETDNNKNEEVNNNRINPIQLYGDQYLENANSDFEILWPKNNYVPAVASTKIMVKSPPKHKIEVFLNDKKVSPLNYNGSDTNKARTVTIRRWVGVDINIKHRDNHLLVILKDKSGKEIARKTHNIHFSGSPASAELLTSQSVLVADGKTTPVIALLIKDEDGFPMRANTHGYYTLKNSNYQPKTLDEDKDRLNLNESLAGSYKYLIGEGGIAHIKLNPTAQSGEVKLNLQFTNAKQQGISKTRTTHFKNDKEISVWLKPHLRKWILVGIAEGTLGYQSLKGNIQTLNDLGHKDSFYKRGRIAFFAKGRVKGKYLLTLAYDTHKQKQEVGSQLGGNIDPDAWYSVYADNSSNQYDAPSSRKLYVKIEKDNFYALFGDYHTGLGVTELARYERVLNGFKTEYKGKINGIKSSVKGFISETSNEHQHREIPGDGTSGLYYLSRGIIPNSESVRIETRDRFHSDQILERRELVRYQDYDIDYDAGTLFFKFPVTGRDADFNPNIIVVDYDSEDEDSNKSITAGGRVAVTTLGDRLETGLSILHKGRNRGRDDRLIATDLTYHLTTDTKIHLEAAQSKTKEGGYKTKHAYIAELEKEIENMEARVYFKKQDGNYGIDSQGSEGGIRKSGAGLRYNINPKTSVNVEISHQKNLANDNKRQLAEVGIEHRYQQIEVSAGARHTRDDISGEKTNNNALLLGGRVTSKNGKVTLRSDIEKNISSGKGSELSPDRVIVGVDVNLKHGFTLFAEHETTENDKETTHNNRVGISKQLWQGADAKTTYTQEQTYQGQRNYATLGLSQKLRVTDKIHADISIDQAKTISDNRDLNKRFNENEPTLQGTQRDDYTAFSIGLGSNQDDWSWTSRFELRKGDVNDKINVQAGLIRYLSDGKNLSAKIDYNHSENDQGDFENHTRLSLGSAWHPKNKDFAFLNRLDLVDEDNRYSNNFSGGFDSLSSIANNSLSGLESHTQKVIHNLHYNHKINEKTQVSIHHGIKHVQETNKETKYNSTVDTATLEVRRDIGKKWDIGMHGGYLHDWADDNLEAVAGVSVGVAPAENTWISLGYNFKGFYDKDFDKGDYKRKGVYMNLRYKFNQNSFDGELPMGEVSEQTIENKNSSSAKIDQKTPKNKKPKKSNNINRVVNIPSPATPQKKKYESLQSVWH